MKKNRTLMIVLPVAAILIAAIIMTAAVLVSRQNKEERYFEELKTAREYLAAGDYDNMIEAYKLAIDIRPEEPAPYVELANAYVSMGDYKNAALIAELGYSRTNDDELDRIRISIPEMKILADSDGAMLEEAKQTSSDPAAASDLESSLLSLRRTLLDTIADYCYGEYEQNYGMPSTKFVSETEGYQTKFNNFQGYAYFKNTSEYDELVDEYKKLPVDYARPYKVVLASPAQLFEAYGDYISCETLGQMFNITPQPIYDETAQKYFIEFDYGNCHLHIETDETGNMRGQAMIEISPLSLIKEEWMAAREENETETESETEPGTFWLGGNEYTYDITDIYIYGEVLEDLSPLSECKNLQVIVFNSCTISSLDPLSGCTALEALELRGSVGFSDIAPLSGLQNLLYLDLHGCSGVGDISAIMNMDLLLLHTCETGVTYEQTQEYKDKHPECEVWYDNRII